MGGLRSKMSVLRTSKTGKRNKNRSLTQEPATNTRTGNKHKDRQQKQELATQTKPANKYKMVNGKVQKEPLVEAAVNPRHKDKEKK